jgi:hypothetical protein
MCKNHEEKIRLFRDILRIFSEKHLMSMIRVNEKLLKLLSEKLFC